MKNLFDFESFEKERELQILAKKKRLNEIKRLKEEAQINKDGMLDDLLEGENKIWIWKTWRIKLYCIIRIKINKITNNTWTNWSN